MFGKKKKEPKIEKVFEPEDSIKDNQTSETNNADLENNNQEANSATEDALGSSTSETEDNSAEIQEDENDKFSSVKSKISKILKSSNIEIIDENEGDEYEFADDADKERQQHEYDELKAMFGNNDKNKKQELTLTIDDFDYTYTGEYIDEYDLVHVKNIKKIKLQRKHSKLTKRIIIAASVLIVVGVGVLLGVLLTRKTPVYLKSISLSKTEQSYYINECFDYTGIYILAEYSDGHVERVKLESKYFNDSNGYVDPADLKFTDGEQATLYFNYSGKRASININILRKNLTGISRTYSKGLLSLKEGDLITNEDLLIFANYSNYNSELIDLSDKKLSISANMQKLVYDEEKGGFVVPFDFDLLGSGSYIEISYDGLKTENINFI